MDYLDIISLFGGPLHLYLFYSVIEFSNKAMYSDVNSKTQH